MMTIPLITILIHTYGGILMCMYNSRYNRSNIVDRCSVADNSTDISSKNTKDDIETLGSSDVTHSSNTSVVSSAKDRYDNDSDANVGIHWAPSYDSVERIRSTRRGGSRRSILHDIVDELVYT